MLGLSGEFGAQNRILGGDTNGARVQVTLAHHGTTHHDERRSTEAELIGAEDRSHHDVEARTQLTVGLDDNSGMLGKVALLDYVFRDIDQ